MALIKCTECGNEISEKAEQCPHCGCPLIPLTKDGKKKDSPLSIVAAVLAFFSVAPYIGYVAFILAVIDLGLNNKTFRHLGSWFTIVFVIFVAILTSM